MRWLWILLVAACAEPVSTAPDLASFVDPFIGTGGHGHTYPGATMPFGMVQLSPDTRLEGWDGCSGYHYTDDAVHGFSHTHLSGTGVSDYGDVLITPGEEKPAKFSKSNESAEPGYYRVELDSGIEVELTATKRVGIHRYRFPAWMRARLSVDLLHRDTVIESSIDDPGEIEIVGHRRSRAWSQDQHVYFVARFSEPIAVTTSVENHHMEALFNYGTSEIVVAVGISAVSIEGARRNLDAEAPHFDFDRYRGQARAAWNDQLSKVSVRGGSRQQKRTFYTALYHSFLAPNLFTDVDGRYRGTDLKVHRAEGYEHYTVFSLWDTFRAAHPLFTILETERTTDFIRTMLAHYRDGGSLPVWELAGWYTGCMIGYHSVPVIVDAHVKGIGGFDLETAYEAMVHSASKNERGLPSYRENGYILAEKAGESVSQTLEYAYDDWCIALIARELGKDADYATYLRRAQSYKNVFDPSTGFMRAKRNHVWVGPFQPREVNTHFTEANSWQYSLFVPHDVDGLMELLGGPKELERWLDSLFTAPTETTGREQSDITGLIGQYAHGNEPSHHMAYLYCFAGKPAKTQQRVRQIVDDLYTDEPDGLCGNEDCGQMSAWYVFSALGFYPVTPGTTEYVIGTPLFPEATLRLENGKRFTVRAVNAGYKYITRAELNGKRYDRCAIDHATIMAGGELKLVMGPNPTTWGREVPRTSIDEHRIVPVPFVASGERAFRGETSVALGGLEGEIVVAWDGRRFEPYTGPRRITRTTEILAYAQRDGRVSPRIRARFYRVPHEWGIELGTEYANQYAATGRRALIDGLRGGDDWRTGDWQGYHEVDVVATIDLGASRNVRAVRGSFLQDQRSWIWLPREVVVEVSDDKQSWRPFGIAGHDVDPKRDEVVRRTMGVESGAQARYVRLTAKSVGRCPDWHPGAGSKAWIFIDEIEVE
ncbi:MAG: GH92 family glycosyl hydrolase [Planctomycetota bacterium]|jgi:predicted alpha-1,2-mannosidase